MNSKKIIYVVVILWAVVFVLPIMMALNVEGPRNIDTGFERLDILARGQMFALALAIMSGAAAFLVKDLSFRQKAIGLAPLTVTILIVAGLFLFAFLRSDDIAAPIEQSRTPTTPVAEPVPVAPAEN